MKLANLISILLITISLSSCGQLGTTTDNMDSDPYPSDLNSNYLKWTQNKPANYSYQYNRLSFGTLKYVITVSNSEIIFVEQTDGYPLINPVSTNSYSSYSIESLFSSISNYLQMTYYKRTLSFDSQYGFPNHCYIDFNQNMSDEEFGMSISNFYLTNF